MKLFDGTSPFAEHWSLFRMAKYQYVTSPLMNPIVLRSAACLAGLVCMLATTANAEDITIGSRVLRVADGFEVELVTTPELVERPIAVARDERGRLYVTDSGGMTERAEAQLEKKPHRIRRLEDTDGDGHYDHSTLFADRMMFPEGCMWYDGSLYVAAPPEIWKLTDDNDDGVADRREVWFDGTTLTGCGNDLHGPYLGHDGRFYWCKGAFAEQRHAAAGGTTFETRASHIFRAKPDSSELEAVLTGGMDNPVNVTFLDNGERFLSCTFFQHPEAGRRDGLIHAIYGGVYGKEHDVILSHPRTGSVMPVLNHQGAAAPCGLIAGSDSLFGSGFDQHLFACYFNLHKVVMHKLVSDGPTYSTEDLDLLACDHPDFHPTDVFEDADGSLLIVDTGGWYKVCCPTSQLAKPDVLGAIYRVRRTGQPTVADPLGLQLDWNLPTVQELVTRLADPRLFVQRRATALLRSTGESGVAALHAGLASDNSDVRTRIVWTLCGMNEPTARSAIHSALQDSDATVQQAAIHSAGLWRDAHALDVLLEVLPQSSMSGIQRAAAEAIGRIGEPRAVDALIAAIAILPHGEPDTSGSPQGPSVRVAEHSLIHALMEINDPNEVRKVRIGSKPGISRATLVALDQMSTRSLSAVDVVPLLGDRSAVVQATAAWVIEQHPDWGHELSEYFADRGRNMLELSPVEREQDRSLLVSLADSEPIQSLLQQWLDDPEWSATRILALQVLASASLSSAPESWLDSLAGQLPESSVRELPHLIEAARNLPQPKDGHAALRTSLRQVAAREDVADALRLTALDTAGPNSELTASTFELLMSLLNPDQLMDQRNGAARVLASASLTTEQRSALLVALPQLGAMELPKLLPAFERDPNDHQGHALLAALQSSAGLTGLRADQLQSVLSKYSTVIQESGRPLLKRLNASLEEQTTMLEQLLMELPEGDVHRGHEVFMSRKAACNTCHKLGYGGGRLGPDLTNLGRVRNRRDVLESLVFPSSSIVRGYEPVTAELHDGRVVSGIVTSESADQFVIAMDAQKSATILRSDVAELSPSAVSAMPNGLVTLLTSQELADLVTFLLTDQR